MDSGQEVISAARELAKIGPVMPVRGKVPLWTDWPARATRAPNGEPEWLEATGVGLLTGERANYFVLDIDGEKGKSSLAALEGEHGSLPTTWVSRTGGGGLHFFFRWPGFLVRGSSGKVAPGIDIRGEGGQVVAPPSVHPSGSRYAWQLPPWGFTPPHDQTPPDAPEWLLDMLRPPAPRLVHSAPAESDILKRAAAYLAKIPGAISGSRGHDAAWRAALAVVRGFALSEADAFALLQAEYNPRCEPPWSEKELRHKVESASRNASVAWGYLRDAPLPTGKPPEPREPREPGSDDGDPTPAIEGPPGRPVSELLRREIPDPKWIVPGRLLEHSIALLAGPPGAGKTFLLYDWLCQAVAAGASVFLGQNEGAEKAMQTRLARSCAAAGIDYPPDRFRYDRNMALPLNDLRSVERFAKRLIGFDIVALDSLASFWPGLDENDPTHMGIAAESLKLLCETSKATSIGLHHTIKSAWKAGEKPSLADIRGHGSLTGRIDSAFIVKPLDYVAGLIRFELHTVKQRDVEAAPGCEMEILMTGPAAVLTQVQTVAKPPTPAEQRLAALEPRVLAHIPLEPDAPTTREALQDALGKRAADIRSVVARLVDRGVVKELSRKRLIRVQRQPRRGEDAAD